MLEIRQPVKSEITIFIQQMPKKLPISVYKSDILFPINHICFWEKGEMAYSALKKINELKANNEWGKAKTMLEDWIL